MYSSNCYLVRTRQELIKQGKVGVGWSDHPFVNFGNAEEVIQAINNDYGIGRRANQVRRFFNLSEGDLIVSTLPYAVAIGPAKGGLLHDTSYNDRDCANQREVEFPVKDGEVVTIPRTSFSEGFQRRLRVRGVTVNNLNEFADEIRQAYESTRTGETHSWKNKVGQQRAEHSKNFRESLLHNIQSGKTNLQTGGLGLEYLVGELLTIDGYKTSIFAKSAFPGIADADIRAVRDDRFTSSELLIQVKHHQGWSGEHGLNQLIELKRLRPEATDGRSLVFLTSASVSEDFIQRADKEEVTVIDGAELVSWIEDSLNSLSDDTKASLGIFDAPCAL